MPEEICMSKTKIVEKIVRFELSLVNYVKVTNRKTFQNKIFIELNSKKHTRTVTNEILRNCGIAGLRKTLVAELRKT